MSALDDLERLARLREQGILTDEEFQSEKRKILNRPATPAEEPVTEPRSGSPDTGIGPPTKPRLELPREVLPVDPDEIKPRQTTPAHPQAPGEGSLAQPWDSLSVGPPTDPRVEILRESPPAGSGIAAASGHSHSGRQQGVSVSETPPPVPQSLRPKRKGGIWMLAAFGLFAIVAVIVVVNMPARPAPQETLPEVVVKRPNPVVVRYKCDERDASLFEYRINVYGTVRNIGDDGYVTITLMATQDGRDFVHRDRRYMRAGEELELMRTFEQPEAGGGEVRCGVSAVPTE